jgi:hypothetical protein|tara:strand:+ start:8218 stop:8511 length:294 start_codon:yes stop_codon:yes gene_type:complete
VRDTIKYQTKGKLQMNELRMIQRMQDIPKEVIENRSQQAKSFATSIQKAMCRYMGHQLQYDMYKKFEDGEEINIKNIRQIIETCIDDVIIKIDNENL